MSNSTSSPSHIPLTRGLYAIVDLKDFHWLMQWKWHAIPHRTSPIFYAKRTNPTKSPYAIWMHREILSRALGQPFPVGKIVDHINGIGTDNRRCNLRLCSRVENARNCKKNKTTTSRFKGVSTYQKGNKWRAKICVTHQDIYLGLFDSEVEAARAYDWACLQLHGNFAHPNFSPVETPPQLRQFCPPKNYSRLKIVVNNALRKRSFT